MLSGKLKDIFKMNKDNYNIISDTYDILEKSYELGIDIHPAGKWILDNMYIIDEKFIEIEESKRGVLKLDLPIVKISNKIKQINIYNIAERYIDENDAFISKESIIHCLKQNQKNTYLTSDELSLFELMIKITVIKFIARICLNIYNSQLQKINIENVIENNLLEKNEEKFKDYIFKELKAFKKDPKIIEKLKSTNTSYIEYLSYRIKEKGEKTDKYYNILLEESEKLGFSVDEVIIKEHMEIAKVTEFIGRGITTLKKIGELNFREVFEETMKTDEILMEDYTGEYKKCDHKTKDRYRNRIIKLSKKFNLSETYIAKKAVEYSKKYKTHVGFFLSGRKKYMLNKAIGKPYFMEYFFNNTFKLIKPYIYIIMILLISISISILTNNYIFGFKSNMKILYYIISVYIYIEIADKLINYLSHKFIPTKTLHRFNFAKTIEKEYSTYVVMPTVINSCNKIDKMIKKMEITYLANRTENMYYMLLGDCTSSKIKKLDVDDKYLEYAKEKLDELNSKYPSENKLFNFIYRKRIYNENEDCYMGYERKRGALHHFNNLILNKISKEEIDKLMYITYDDIVNVKYVITIDEDTYLSLNTAKDLVGIISHPLNRPILSKDGKRVISGHALIQPKVGLDIKEANKSIFSKIFGGFGGIDIYTTAVSDTYQDNFNEGIFCGKGIYDVEVFENVLEGEIPENLVLSHDLLEGSYLRCGLASDIEVQDGFPLSYVSYMKRNHRWFRGDMQIIKWLNPFNFKLNTLSKWKIFDNLRRPLLSVILLFSMILSLIFAPELFMTTTLMSFVIVNFGDLIGFIESIILGHPKKMKKTLYIPLMQGFPARILIMTLNFVTIPYKAYMCLDAFTRSLYRMYISKKKLLEWKTGETLDKEVKKGIMFQYRSLFINVITAVLIIVYTILFIKIGNIYLFSIFIGLSFLVAPILTYLLDKCHLFHYKQGLNEKQKKEILEIGKRTWKFFEMSMTKANNYLPTDNYQENRERKIVNRTSSTNIGFGILAIINAYDLKFISLKEAIEKLIKIMSTVEKLEKWYGHLFNWYNIKSLEPLRPRFVSTVDSGNFLSAIYVLRGFLLKINEKDEVSYLKNLCDQIINDTDFTKLYSNERNLFSIGYNQENNTLVDSYYDMLMSENRTTSLIAIASRQITSKHWFALGRKVANLKKHRGLVSWSGTAFEYYMPYLFSHSSEHTLIDQSLYFSKYCQQRYVKKRNMPWGISESAYAKVDDDFNYQYKAFGIPILGLKRGLKDYLVVSPYASLLALEFRPLDVYKNIKKLKKVGAYSNFGFYEAIDYTKKHLMSEDYRVIKSYMTHHQGMILTSINNYLNKAIIKERFNYNPEIKAVEILHEEREIIYNKNKVKRKSVYEIAKEKEKFKIESYSAFINNKGITSKYNENKIFPSFLKSATMSAIYTSNGNSYLRYKNKIVNVHRYNEGKYGNFVYIKDTTTGDVLEVSNTDIAAKNEKYKSNLYTTLNSIVSTINSKELECKCETFMAHTIDSEIKEISLYNPTNVNKTIEIITYIEPALTDYMTSVVHPSFNNLQIETYYDKQLDMLVASKRLKNEKDKPIYMYSKLLGIDLEKDVETEKVKFDEGSNAFDNNISNYPLWPILSYKTKIYLNPHERQTFHYLVGVSENKYGISSVATKTTKETISSNFRLSQELATITSKYLKLETKNTYKYNEIIYDLLFSSNKKSNEFWDVNIDQSMFWKYGLSGDLPMLLVNVNSLEESGIIHKVILFMDYVKNRKIDIDILVVVNDDRYPMKAYEYVKGIVSSTTFTDFTKGNIFVFSEKNISVEDKKLFEFTCRRKIDKIDDFLDKYMS